MLDGGLVLELLVVPGVLEFGFVSDGGVASFGFVVFGFAPF